MMNPLIPGKKNRRLVNLLLPVFLIIIILSCESLNEDHSFKVITGNYSYQLDSPLVHLELSRKLEEISGLDYLGDGIMLCVQDEEGILFFYDIIKKEIVREIRFKKSGDYEGVAQIDSIVYIVQSDGDLFPIPLNEGNKVEIEKTSTSFGGSNDIEGLCAGHKNNTLYMVCKGNPEINNNSIEGRAVYEFNILNNRVRKDPVINLTSSEFRDWLKNENLNPRIHMPFKPSGIAVHPFTGDIFLIASVGQLLIVMDKNGNLVSLSPLKKSLLKQPEGISFDEKGNLYISSEGRGNPGYILQFKVMIDQDQN